MPKTEAQKLAQAKWNAKNRDKVNLHASYAHARLFIKNTQDIERLELLKFAIDEKLIALRKDSK